MPSRGRATPTSMILALALLLPAVPAAASVKNLVEACGELDRDLRRLLDNEVALVDAGAVSRNADGTYRLTTQVYTMGAGSFELCTDSRFYGQKLVFGLPFRSAVQVGPDLVLTAWHNPTNGIMPGFYAIFGLRYRLVNGRCVAPDLERVPPASVFYVTEIVADGLGGDAVPPRDFLLLRLDRDASGDYPRVRRSGQGRADAAHRDRMTMISHPDRLAAKVDLAGRLSGYSAPDYDGPQVENIHPLQWSSGGMLYNRDASFVETVARSVVSARYGHEGGACFKIIEVAGPKATNDSVAGFAQNIPAFELLVTPLDAVVHEGPVGGPFTNPVTMRTIEVPVTAPRGIAYRIQPPTTSPGQPELLVSFGGMLQGTLPPGAGFDVEESINANGLPCGEYEQSYVVTDDTHGWSDVVRHIVRIKCQ
jgi:hypothetical protein